MIKIVVLTGAGISAESGIKTFRDENGLWEGHDVMQVASPKGWEENPVLVLDFYNQRRRQLKSVKPNTAHKALVELEKKFSVNIITQNVDDLHERAGSSDVLHLHGELLKARSSIDKNLIIPWETDINLGDLCPNQSQLRPHIVWFGEEVPLLFDAQKQVQQADSIIVIGTSMQVYPAAGLIDFAHESSSIYYIDPKPARLPKRIKTIAKTASEGVPLLTQKLLNTV